MPPKALRLIDLNPPQREAVKQIEGPVLLLAGAGSGKTRVVTTRIAYMLTQDVKASEILAVTFTNKAANEMRERVASMVTKKQAEEVSVSTFHSLCVRVLRSGIHKLGYTKDFTIYTAGDQLGLIRKIIVRKIGKNEKAEPGRIQSLISRYKNKGVPVSPDEDALESHVLRAYQQELKRLNAVDFDDLLLFAVHLLEEYEDIYTFWSNRFNYIMVDEFQDTNKTQMDLVIALARKHQNICVVGDDDQSIYGWRGAEIKNILDFERYFKNPRVIKLEQNYRSTTPILELANGLIKFNKSRREKRLWTDKRSARPVQLIGMPSDREEAETVASEIWEEGEGGGGRPYEEFAVLFRMNSQSRALEEAMRNLEIPYRVIGGQSFFDRREVKDILSYISLIANPKDDIALLRVANFPARGISDMTVEVASEHSVDKQQPIFETFEDPEFLQLIGARAQESVGRFCRMIHGFREQVSQPLADLGGIVHNLIRETDYVKAMKRTCRTDAERDSRESNIRELVESVYRFVDDRRAKNKHTTLTEFLNAMALDDSKRDTGDDIEKKKGVSLITLHASKGLEFPVVYLVGLEERILPHGRSLEEGTKDEERRLLYVGITRAMEELTLSYCMTRQRFGQVASCQPSSFIQELNPEHMNITTLAQLAEVPATKEATKSFFGMMKDRIAE